MFGKFRTEEERRAYYKGIRAAVAWLHAEALTMNDPHARSVLNSAGFHLGLAKPEPADPAQTSPEGGSSLVGEGGEGSSISSSSSSRACATRPARTDGSGGH
jgi:hypothetical protein